MNECAICGKEVKKDENWRWADEPAHKICVLTEAETACDDMVCFGMVDDTNEDCECGLKMKKLTKREKKALLVGFSLTEIQR
jgi:hypothetical protein